MFPPICAGCRKRGTWFCDRCRSYSLTIPRPICHRCGQPSSAPVFTCPTCDHWPLGLGSVRAAFVFDGSIRDQVHRYKYRGEFARAQSLADIMFERIIDHEFVDHTSWDVVAHVPLHRRRRRERGFDQAEFLARRLAQRLGLPLQEGLERIRDTPSQVGQGEAERLTNVRDAFALVDEPLVGRSVLLIDDVITTGATLIAASQPLLNAGATRVDGFALARELLDSQDAQRR